MPHNETLSSTRVALLGEEVAPGHCVIINSIDRPCVRLIAVIEEIEGDTVTASYLTDRTLMRRCYSLADRVTPLALFGVQAFVEAGAVFVGHPAALTPTATYPDGRARRWQAEDPWEAIPVRTFPARVAITKAIDTEQAE